MKPIPLKMMFELRHSTLLRPRRCVGRVFFFAGKWGVCDVSATLYPILWNEKETPVHGDVIDFECSFTSGHLHIERILQRVPHLEEWKNAVIPCPLPRFSQDENGGVGTAFYPSPQADRLQKITQRNRALTRTKDFFNNRGFLNIETPTLVPSGGVEVYLNPFRTHYVDHRNQTWSLELPTSPEFALKKMLVEHHPKVFQLARAYRNCGELSKQHEPEFCMLEWYRVGATLHDVLLDTQNLVVTLARFLGCAEPLPHVWPIFRVDELFQRRLNLNLEKLQNTSDFYQAALPHSLSLAPSDTWDDIFCKLFMEKIEPFLKEQRACFVSHYPIQMAALAAPEVGKPFAHRAEGYLFGHEICNAYLELVDSELLCARFAHTQRLKPQVQRDPVFENAMAFGLPPCAGNALGIDRVIALLVGTEKIADLYPIPFLSQFLKNTIAAE